MHREETSSKESPTASVAPEQAAVAQEVIDQEVITEIDVEFEKYLAMRSAVRKQSGKWRRSSLTGNAH